MSDDTKFISIKIQIMDLKYIEYVYTTSKSYCPIIRGANQTLITSFCITSYGSYIGGQIINGH